MSDSLREDQVVAQRHYRKFLALAFDYQLEFGGWIHIPQPSLRTFVLGPKYAMAAWMMQLLGVRGALELFMSVAVSMLFALGTSKYAAIGTLISSYSWVWDSRLRLDGLAFMQLCGF